MMQEILNRLNTYTSLRQIDIESGIFLARLTRPEHFKTLLALTGACLSKSVSQGHVCLPLTKLQEALCFLDKSLYPDIQKLRSDLTASTIVGSPGDNSPLVLDKHDQLYMFRHYQFEDIIAQNLSCRCAGHNLFDIAAVRTLLLKMFPAFAGQAEPDWQAAAVALSLISPLLVVSGGPGTGKTYTAARILAANITLAKTAPRILLAAPTGKAAARLNEAMQQIKSTLSPAIAQYFPDNVLTIHRLLRFHPHKRQFAHNRHNRLHADIILVDEASMIDVPLMSALLEALPSSCSLVLFGDRGQLASVEAGNLFSDICGQSKQLWSSARCNQMRQLCGTAFQAKTNPHPLDDCLIELKKSYRFEEHSGINALAMAIRAGDNTQLEQCLGSRHEDLILHLDSPKSRPAWLKECIVKYFAPVLCAASPQDALQHFEQCRILCAVHHGPTGTQSINSHVESVLAANIRHQRDQHYMGRPIIIESNNYDLELFNGDTGILWPDSSGELQAWFLKADGSLQHYSPLLLPAHQTGFAMTVHRSQGSEFETVIMLLPDQDSPVLTKELLYTAVTRSKKKLVISASKTILQNTIQKQTVRYSGLSRRLRPQSAAM